MCTKTKGNIERELLSSGQGEGSISNRFWRCSSGCCYCCCCCSLATTVSAAFLVAAAAEAATAADTEFPVADTDLPVADTGLPVAAYPSALQARRPVVQEGQEAAVGHGGGSRRVRAAAVQRAGLRARGLQLYPFQGQDRVLFVSHPLFFVSWSAMLAALLLLLLLALLPLVLCCCECCLV